MTYGLITVMGHSLLSRIWILMLSAFGFGLDLEMKLLD